MRIYLDVCCLCRPFDDQRIERNRLETEAISSIFERIGAGELHWISSEIVDEEIEKTPDIDHRKQLEKLTQWSREFVEIEFLDVSRIRTLMELGFKLYDSMHIVCAEKGNADILLTTDDRLLNRASQRSDDLDVQVANPVNWLREVFQDED